MQIGSEANLDELLCGLSSETSAGLTHGGGLR